MKQTYEIRNDLPSVRKLSFPHAGAVTLAVGETKKLQLDETDAAAIQNTHGFTVSAPAAPKPQRVPGANAPRAPRAEKVEARPAESKQKKPEKEVR